MPNKVLTVVVPSNPIEVLTIRVPGQQGPGGIPGPPGPSSVLSIGTVSSLAEGATATATLSGVSPTQTLNLGIPRGATGAAGPPSALSVGTITTSAPGGNGAATITGTAPNYTLNLTLPRGYGVPSLGTANQVLVKNSSTDYDTGWLSFDTAATANTLVRRDAAGDIYVVDAYGSAAPTVANQLTRKDYVDTQVATRATTVHTHTASQISDSTATGRSVLMATDGPAARTAIGAGTGNSNLALGTTSTTAKAGDYQPTAANISDSTTVGRSVLTATDQAAARTAIGAGTGNGSSNLVLGTTSTTAKAGDYSPPAATEAVSGISRFATSSETTAGSLNSVSVHPAGLATALSSTITTARQEPLSRNVSGAITIAATDAYDIVMVNNTVRTSVLQATLPTNATVPLAVGTWIDVCAPGIGTVLIAGASGVTLRGDGRVYGNYGVSRILKVATDEWVIINTFLPKDAFARCFAYADTGVTGWAAGFNYLPLNAESIDTHNGHPTGAISGSDVDTTTKQNRYTCQPGQAGEYLVSAMINITVGVTSVLHCRILKNNTWFRGCAGLITSSSVSGTVLTGEKLVTLAEGDWVTAQHYCNTANYNTDANEQASGGATNWMSVNRIS